MRKGFKPLVVRKKGFNFSKVETFKAIARYLVLKRPPPFRQKAACKFKKLAAFWVKGRLQI